VKLHSALAALLAAASLQACLMVQNEPGVLFATDPPGARVVVDGTDSGMVTPCHIHLPRDPQRVDLELAGYVTATRYVGPDSGTEILLWDEMAVATGTWRNPVWLEWWRFVFPIWHKRGMSPSRIYVRMRISGEE